MKGKSSKQMDKEISKGILDRLTKLSDLKVTRALSTTGNDGYSFEMDDFDINIYILEGCSRIFGIPIASDGGYAYELYVDYIHIQTRHKIGKKIYQMVEYLYNKPTIENIEFIKKDAYINFKKDIK